MTTITETDLGGAVAGAAAHLYVWALKDIPQDLRDALGSAAERETSITGQRVLQTILKNVSVAEDEKNLVCQDTGIAVYLLPRRRARSTPRASTQRSRRVPSARPSSTHCARTPCTR